MAAAPEVYVFMAFPSAIPVKDYIQALAEMMLFFNNTKYVLVFRLDRTLQLVPIVFSDILSFYKEELAGETTNQISIMAAHNKTSKLDALNALVETTANIFENAVEILNGSPAACATFKKFAMGLVRFHIFAKKRYRLADLKLQ